MNTITLMKSDPLLGDLQVELLKFLANLGVYHLKLQDSDDFKIISFDYIDNQHSKNTKSEDIGNLNDIEEEDDSLDISELPKIDASELPNEITLNAKYLLSISKYFYDIEREEDLIDLDESKLRTIVSCYLRIKFNCYLARGNSDLELSFDISKYDNDDILEITIRNIEWGRMMHKKEYGKLCREVIGG